MNLNTLFAFDYIYWMLLQIKITEYITCRLYLGFIPEFMSMDVLQILGKIRMCMCYNFVDPKNVKSPLHQCAENTAQTQRKKIRKKDRYKNQNAISQTNK